ncbi:hypothetical protein QBC45DRAFT_332890, partial [Copromyces sp. CBS 386.78]
FYYLLAYLSPTIKRLLVVFSNTPSSRSPIALINKLRLTYREANASKKAS